MITRREAIASYAQALKRCDEAKEELARRRHSR